MSRKCNKIAVGWILLKIKGYRPQGIQQWGDLQKDEVLVYINIESQQPKIPYAL